MANKKIRFIDTDTQEAVDIRAVPAGDSLYALSVVDAEGAFGVTKKIRFIDTDTQTPVDIVAVDLGNDEYALGVKSESPGTKEIVVGNGPGYRADGAVGTMSSFYGAGSIEVWAQRTFKAPCTGEIVGLAFANTMGGTGSGQTRGEGQTGTALSTVTHHASFMETAAMATHYRCFANIDTGDRALQLTAERTGQLRMDRALPVLAGTVMYYAFTAVYAADTDNSYRQFAYNYVTGETEFRTAVSGAGAALTAMDAISAVPSGSARTTINSLTSTIAPAGVVMRVKASQPHFAIWGTSREIGHLIPWLNPTVRHSGYWDMALDAEGIPSINFAKGSAAATYDMTLQFSGIRRKLSEGVTHVVIGHNQNDLAALTLAQYQALMVTQCAYFRSLGMKVIVCTCDPWTQASTSVSNAIDDYSGQANGGPSQSLANSGVNTERLALNAWLRGAKDGVTSDGGGDGTTTVEMICDYVVDTAAAVEDASNPGFWKNAVAYGSGTSSTGHSTSVLNIGTALSAANVAHDQLVRTLTAADASIFGIIRGNGTTTALTMSTNFASTPGNSKAYTIWFTYTNDGIHASHYGNLAKKAVVQAFLQGVQ